MTRPTAVIVDIDGTIAQHIDRDVYDFSKVSNDIPKPSVIQWLKTQIPEDSLIVFLTGRDDICWNDTWTWLDTHIRPHFTNDYTLVMRNTGDYRSSPITKKELYENGVGEFAEEQHDVLFAIDDMMKNCLMWKHECNIRSYFVDGDKISEII